jgi:hypothetical protein
MFQNVANFFTDFTNFFLNLRLRWLLTFEQFRRAGFFCFFLNKIINCIVKDYSFFRGFFIGTAETGLDWPYICRGGFPNQNVKKLRPFLDLYCI